MSDFDDSLDIRGLDALLKALKNPPEARVGILGGGSPRSAPAGAPAPSNATIGAIHEFGTSRVPKRSWLRMPITLKLDKALKAAGLFDPEALRKIIATGSIRDIVAKIAVVAETVVLEAFDTGGFGNWKKSDMRRKKNHQTLVETQQLRNAVTSEVSDA